MKSFQIGANGLCFRVQILVTKRNDVGEWQVDAVGLRIECARVLHEGLLLYLEVRQWHGGRRKDIKLKLGVNK